MEEEVRELKMNQEKLIKQINSYQRLMNMGNMSNLPDGGAKLKQTIETLEVKLGQVEQLINSEISKKENTIPTATICAESDVRLLKKNKSASVVPGVHDSMPTKYKFVSASSLLKNSDAQATSVTAEQPVTFQKNMAQLNKSSANKETAAKTDLTIALSKATSESTISSKGQMSGKSNSVTSLSKTKPESTLSITDQISGKYKSASTLSKVTPVSTISMQRQIFTTFKPDEEIVEISSDEDDNVIDSHIRNTDSGKLKQLGNTMSVKLQVASSNPNSVIANGSKQKGTFLVVHEDLQRRIQEKNRVEQNFQQKKRLLTMGQMTSLPDGGAKIKSQVDELASQLSALKLDIERKRQEVSKMAPSQAVLDALDAGRSQTVRLDSGQTVKLVAPAEMQSGRFLRVTQIGQSNSGGSRDLPQFEDLAKNVAGGSSGETFIGPSFTLLQERAVTIATAPRQTLMTDYSTLPDHVIKQMYSANPQMTSLYGGRMTAARLEQVGSVTTEAIEKLHSQLKTMPPAEAESEDPKNLTVPLMTHQRQALAWLAWRETQEPAGGILADDMGLGKTLTMISLIMKQKHGAEKDDQREQWLSKLGPSLIPSRGTLVVCPASLVHQWQKEIERRCSPGLLRVTLYHGPDREKSIKRLAKSDVVLTTYNIVCKEVGVSEELKKNRSAQEMPITDKDDSCDYGGLGCVVWERLILDEAHNIKNHRSLSALSVSKIRATYRWALTGTPIQNALLDMYALLRFLRCSPFDEFKVWKRQVDNQTDKGRQRLNSLIQTLLLRRTKQQVDASGKPLVPLPEKKSYTHKLSLSAEEKKVYGLVYKQSKSVVEAYLKQGQQPPGGGAKKIIGTQVLLLLLRLRQCCSHPGLLKEIPDEETVEGEGLELDLIEQMGRLDLGESSNASEPSLVDGQTSSRTAVYDKAFSSTKIKMLLEMLTHICSIEGSSPRKCVIVSQWTAMLDIVERHLDDAKISSCSIRGSIPPKVRSKIVDDFNGDPKGPQVMLLSLRAGGVGLNLVGANYLFLLDMHWNPALEEQACDRIYRVGQKRRVHIHRFICEETVEEKIVKLQHHKKSLAHDILTKGPGEANTKLTLDDLRELFGLQSQ